MPRPLLAVLAAVLAAACAPDRSGGDPPDSAAQGGAVEEEVYVPPALTPAESAAAVARQAADAEAATRRVMGPDYEPPAEPYVDTPEKRYASCMAQAQSVEEPVKSTILRACERFRAQR